MICPIGLTPSFKSFTNFQKISKVFSEFTEKIAIPSKTIFKGIEVYYPKWFWLPKVLFWFYEVHFLHFFLGKFISKVINTYEPDLILTSWLHPFGTYSDFLKKEFDIPIYVFVEGSDILILPGKYCGIEKIMFRINRSCDKFIFVSEWQKLNTISRFKINNSIVLNNGYDQSLFYYQRNKKDKVRDVFNIISIGNLYPVKGHDLLLKAVCDLEINYKLIIIGNGFLMSDYVSYIKENNLSENVQILPAIPQNELIDIMSDADVCCMPSRSEGFSIAGLEALACGLPLVATNVGGFSEIIQEGVNGYVISTENSSEITEALFKASITQWDYEKIALNAKEKYSWENWVNKVEMFYTNY